MANFGLLSRVQPHSPDVNHCVLHFRPEGHWEPRGEVGSLSPAKCLVGFEPGTFQFLLQCLNPLIHSPHLEITLPFAKLGYTFEEKKFFFCHHSFMKKSLSKLFKNEPEDIP